MCKILLLRSDLQNFVALNSHVFPPLFYFQYNTKEQIKGMEKVFILTETIVESIHSSLVCPALKLVLFDKICETPVLFGENKIQDLQNQSLLFLTRLKEFCCYIIDQ